MNDTTRRIVRTLCQLVAGGALGGLVTQLVLDTPDRYDPYIVLASSALVAIAQLILEEWTGQDIGVRRSAGK
jgi:homoserine acetyltransferase